MLRDHHHRCRRHHSDDDDAVDDACMCDCSYTQPSVAAHFLFHFFVSHYSPLDDEPFLMMGLRMTMMMKFYRVSNHFLFIYFQKLFTIYKKAKRCCLLYCCIFFHSHHDDCDDDNGHHVIRVVEVSSAI